MTRTTTPPAPAPLIVAASLVVVEALLLLLYGVLALADLSEDTLAFGGSAAVFLLLCAAGLLYCAWKITRGESWARSPLVLAQLLLLGLAWDQRTNSGLLSAGLAVVAFIVIAGVLHPASIEHLADEAPGTPDA